jgi:ketosteroid isomerase-like protein
MKRRVLALVLFTLTLTLVAVVFAQAPAANRAATEKQIVANERTINEAVAKADLKGFNALVAPDAVSMDSGGIMKTGDPNFEKMVKEMKITSWNLEGSQFLWINDNTVVHMYKWTGKGTYQGQPVPSPTWASTVWANKGGKWMATFHQESLAMPAPAPAPAGKK